MWRVLIKYCEDSRLTADWTEVHSEQKLEHTGGHCKRLKKFFGSYGGAIQCPEKKVLAFLDQTKV